MQSSPKISLNREFIFLLLLLLFELPLTRALASNLSTSTDLLSDTKVLCPETIEERIPGLTFPTGKIQFIPISETPGSPKSPFEVKVFGKKRRTDDSALTYENHVVHIERRSDLFDLVVRVVGESTPIKLIQIDSSGKVTKETCQLVVPALQRFLPKKNVELFKKWIFFSGIDISSNAYTQAGFPDYSGIALNLRQDIIYKMTSSRFDYYFSGFFSLIPLTTSISNIQFRFLDLEAGSGYTFLKSSSPWTFKTLLGLYYTTSFVSGTSEGYQNIAGPELGQTVVKDLASGKELAGYIKFAPVSSGFSFFTLSNRRITAGLSYQIPVLNSNRTWVTRFDFNNVTLAIVNGQAQSNFFSVGAQYIY
jgi:hypothetical protein